MGKTDYPQNKFTEDDTIAASSSSSGGVNNPGLTPTGIIIPATMTNTTLDLQASFDNGSTWHDVFDKGGTKVSVTVANTGLNVFEAEAVRGLTHVRVNGSSNETAERTLTWVFKAG